MAAIVFCWAAATACGMLGLRRWTAAGCCVVLIAFVRFQGQMLALPAGLAAAAILVATPWLLYEALQREQKTAAVLRSRQEERKAQLSTLAQNLFSMDASLGLMEQELARLADVYRVTKDTAGVLRLADLLSSARESLSRLLEAHTLRLIDLTSNPPSVSRLRHDDHKRFIQDSAGAAESSRLDALEQAIVERARSRSEVKSGDVSVLAIDPVPGAGAFAWAPLMREEQLLGVLIAEAADEASLPTLSTITHQLSLQCARIQLYEQVEALAVTDSLSGLFVRGYVLRRAKEELERSQAQGLSCTAMMVDLDFFKQKNDTYGHLVGDAVLKEVARILQRNLREVDLIGRYGGEEFFLLLIETHVEQALPIAHRLRQLVEIHPIRAYDELLTQTISIGMAGFPQHAADLEELIERADEALYAAKRAGRNRVVVWSPAATG